MNKEKDWWTTAMLAKASGVCTVTAYRWCSRGVLPAQLTPGGHFRIWAEDARAFVMSMQRKRKRI